MSNTALVQRYEVLVFDLDGTLVDSAGDISRTLSLSLVDCGLPPLATGARLADLFSPLPEIVQSVLTLRGEITVNAQEVVVAYHRRQKSPSYGASALYPGVSGFLLACQQRGHRMAVCTNKVQAQAVHLLHHFGLLDYFTDVIGGDTAATAKPSAAPLLLTLERLTATPAQALMFGDTHVDAICAHQSQVDFVWHRNGYGGDEVLLHPVAASFDSFVELHNSICTPD